MSQNFPDDLKTGIDYEDAFVELCRGWGYAQAHRAEQFVQGFDVVIPELDLRVEVKYQRAEAKTGNCAIEISYNGEPSGIASTTSDWWAIFTDTELFVAPVETLRALIRDGNFRLIAGGDNKAAQLALVSTSKLRRYPGVRSYGYGLSSVAA